MKKKIYLALGILSLALGMIGIGLPVVPTTPFLILAAYFFSKSSERFHRWLVNHRLFGPMIKDWQDQRAIPLKAKIMALLMLSGSTVIIFMNDRIPDWGKASAATVILVSAAFIVTRNTARS